MKNYGHVAAWIDLDAIYGNLKALKEHTKEGTKLCVVVKADGYGHGAVPVAKRAKGLADFFAVSAIEEALNLKHHDISEPILVLGYTPRESYRTAIMEGVRLNVFHYEMAKALSEEAVRCGKPAIVHIKLETGMNRLGFQPGPKALSEIEEISRMPGIQLEGIFSHFAKADEEDQSFSVRQYERFQSFCLALQEKRVDIPIRHMGNSAVIIGLPQFDADMVRAGIATYGLYPSDEVDRTAVKLTPALRLTSLVTFVKTIEAGETVGYGGTYTAKRKTRIATVPVGYGDGYPRNLSNRGWVLIHGKKAPITGRVCMDQLMVDVTDIEDVKEEDEVVLVGRDGEEQITVEELAGLAGSFHYEFVCNLGKRIPRIYVSGGKIVGTKDYFNDVYSIEL